MGIQNREMAVRSDIADSVDIGDDSMPEGELVDRDL